MRAPGWIPVRWFAYLLYTMEGWRRLLKNAGMTPRKADSNGGGGPVISLTVRGHGKHVLLSRAKEEGGGAENGVGGNGTSGQQMHQRM